jgi:hypothetical protein
MVFEKILGNLLMNDLRQIMRKYLQHNIFLLLILVLVALSCSTTRNISIEIPQEAQKELPDSIQSLLLVNRTVNEKYTDLKADSLQRLFYKQQFNSDTTIYDITAADTLLKALGELLFESGRYDFVIPENRFLSSEKNAFFSQEMTQPEVRLLCETYNTDAVLSVDHFSTKVVTRYGKDSYFDPFRNGFISVAGAEMKIVYEALFRVYSPNMERPIVREFFKDTLVWEDMAETPKELFRKFTPVKNGLTEAGIALALDFSEKISTNWRPESRPVFIKGNAELKQAGTLIDAGNWQGARAIWEELTNYKNSKSVRSKAQFNLAVASEIQGDIDSAIKWGVKSYETMYRPVTYQYLEVLKRRKKELSK